MVENSAVQVGEYVFPGDLALVLAHLAHEQVDGPAAAVFRQGRGEGQDDALERGLRQPGREFLP